MFTSYYVQFRKDVLVKYKCMYVDSGICFFYDSVRVCCKSSHNGIGMPHLSEYGEFDIKEILRKKEQYKQALYNGQVLNECKGCVFLKETNEINEDNSIFFIDIDSFSNCNSKCVYCNVHSLNIEEHPVLPFFESLFNEKMLRNDKYGYIQFAGGEPTIMKDFEKIVDLCLKNGIENYMIHTNGIKFSKSIENLIKKAKVKLIISLDSSSRDTFKKINE